MRGSEHSPDICDFLSCKISQISYKRVLQILIGLRVAWIGLCQTIYQVLHV